jgi:hypothetical protein
LRDLHGVLRRLHRALGGAVVVVSIDRGAATVAVMHEVAVDAIAEIADRHAVLVSLAGPVPGRLVAADLPRFGMGMR